MVAGKERVEGIRKRCTALGSRRTGEGLGFKVYGKSGRLSLSYKTDRMHSFGIRHSLFDIRYSLLLFRLPHSDFSFPPSHLLIFSPSFLPPSDFRIQFPPSHLLIFSPSFLPPSDFRIQFPTLAPSHLLTFISSTFRLPNSVSHLLIFSPSFLPTSAFPLPHSIFPLPHSIFPLPHSVCCHLSSDFCLLSSAF